MLGSIRGRLTLLVAAVVIPTAFLAAALMLQGYRNERDAVENHLSATARSFTLQVDHQFLNREALLKGLVGSTALEKEDWRAFFDQAKSVATGEDEWIVLVDPTGKQLINTSRPYGMPLPTVAVTAEFRTVTEAGRTYISNLVWGPVRKHFVVYAALPIFREGQLRYTLHFAMFPSALSDWMISGEAPRTWIISLLDREGKIAARNHSPETYVGSKARAMILDKVQGSDESAILGGKTLEGIDVLTAFSRCSLSGWSVAVGVPTEELYAPARHLLYLAVAISSFSFVILALMAVWIARGMVHAIGSLVADAQALGQGSALIGGESELLEIDVVGDALRRAAEQLAIRESDLKQLNETLDSRVQVRTRELAHANRELENFARIASHDLKEPLRLMTAYASLLRAEYHEQFDPTGRLYIERIEASAQRQRALIDDILAYSRVGSFVSHPERVNLDAILTTVKSDLEIRLKETSGTIEADTLGFFRGDPAQLHQLFINLIANGLKFHRAGVPPIVQVSVRREAGFLHLIVEDNGIGFDSRYAEKIFSPFERLHSGNEYEGTGMGLAIVRRIAERHGGIAKAESTPGQGSRFEVSLAESGDR